MMKKLLRRVIALTLSAVTAVSLCLPASAFTYPSTYWKLHDGWMAAKEQENQGQILSLSQKTYDLLTQQPICADICYNLEPKCALASWCCEMQGDLDGAIEWAQRQLVYARWLDSNVRSYRDTILNVTARLEYLQAAGRTTLYTLTDRGGDPYPGTGAVPGGIWYGTPDDTPQSGQTASLIYVTFGESHGMDYWLSYYRKTSDAFRAACTTAIRW